MVPQRDKIELSTVANKDSDENKSGPIETQTYAHNMTKIIVSGLDKGVQNSPLFTLSNHIIERRVPHTTKPVPILPP